MTDFWIGGDDLSLSGTWTWTDNSSFNYTNWASGKRFSKPNRANSFIKTRELLINIARAKRAFCRVSGYH